VSGYDHIPDFGALYDAVPMYGARRDVAFYVEEAMSTSGAVLELGCGSGRILLPIARAGRTVTGVDSSREMLSRLEAKLAGEPDEIRRHASLHQGDARGFALNRQFALAIAPFRVFQHLTTVDEQLRALETIRRHLLPGGRLVFDVYNPRFDWLVAADGAEHEDTPSSPLADGRTFRRTARVFDVRWVEQMSRVELIYYVSGPGSAPEQRFTHAFDMRLYLAAELEHLLARAGFRDVTLYGDFDRSPVRDGSPELLVTATRP
jgi:SAM-dependent methyltransferase